MAGECFAASTRGDRGYGRSQTSSQPCVQFFEFYKQLKVKRSAPNAYNAERSDGIDKTSRA